MRYLFIIGLLLNSLLAHSGDIEHIHFFSTLHLDGFILFLVGVIGSYLIYEQLRKRGES